MSDHGPASARYQALIQLLRTAEDLWNASRVFFSRWDLSPSQFNVLNVLYGQIDGLSQSELSRLLIMHRSNATGLVDRLERRRLVKRTEDAQDRRAYRVILTPEGLQLLGEIYPHYYAAADEVWSGLDDTRVVEILTELQQLAHQATQIAARQVGAPFRPPANSSRPTTANPSPEGETPANSQTTRRKARRRDDPPAPDPTTDLPANSGEADEGLRTTDL